MDCTVPVDDYCSLWKMTDENLPEGCPPRTTADCDLYFYIKVDLEIIYPPDDDDEEGDTVDNLENLKSAASSFTFTEPCKNDSVGLSRERISWMLTEIGVPAHKQSALIPTIATQFGKFAKSNRELHGGGRRVLPVALNISMIACDCVPPLEIQESEDGTVIN